MAGQGNSKKRTYTETDRINYAGFLKRKYSLGLIRKVAHSYSLALDAVQVGLPLDEIMFHVLREQGVFVRFSLSQARIAYRLCRGDFGGLDRIDTASQKNEQPSRTELTEEPKAVSKQSPLEGSFLAKPVTGEEIERYREEYDARQVACNE